MGQAIQIGRCGRGAIILDGIATWDVSGRVVDVTGVLHANMPPGGTTVPSSERVRQVLAERQRLSGYVVNTDEPFVPVLWECDPVVNGFYRILDANVAFEGPSIRHGIFPIEITMEQITGFASPQFESFISGGLIETNHAVDWVAWFSYPDAVKEQLYDVGCRTRRQRPTPDGILWFTDCFQILRNNFFHFLTPEDFYIGAGVIEVGDPLEVVVGTQIPRTLDNWRVSNGLVRVEPGPNGTFLVSHFDGDVWTTPKSYTFFGESASEQLTFSAGDMIEFTNISVIRNSPETVVFRTSCVFENLGRDWGRTFIDIRLRKGDRVARFVLRTDRANSWGVKRTDAEAASSLTGGIRASSDDAEGHRYVLTTSYDFASDLTQGSIRQTPLQTGWEPHKEFNAGIGLAIDGGDADDTAGAQDLVNQYFSWQSEKLHLAMR